MHGEPEILYPSMPRSRSLPARARRAARHWSGRVRENVEPVVRGTWEIRRASGRSAVSILRQLFAARLFAGVPVRTFLANRMWDVPRARWSEFVSAKELDPFFAATIDPEDRLLIRDKAGFADHGRRLGMPWLPALAIVNRHEGPAIEGAVVVDSKDSLRGELERLAASRGDLFLKPSCGKQGRGAYRYTKEGHAHDANGREIALRDLLDRVFTYRHPSGAFGYVVQSALEAHPDIFDITGVPVLSTVRIVTAVRDGRTYILQALFKVPGPGRLTDNFQGGVTGSTVAGIDPESGRLLDLVGILRPGNRYVCERTETHPVTGRRIAGREVPRWNEALELARRAALLQPRTATLGWDIGLAPSGWVFLDVNGMWSPAGEQLCTRQGMRPLLAKLFPEHWSVSAAP
jgi:hypothetical protein